MDLAGFDLSALLPFIAVGFAAQLVDGALGMAFGVISNTLLVAIIGIPPAQASAQVHVVKVFTGGISSLSHVLHGNVDWRLLRRLLLPAMLGGIIGALGLAALDAALDALDDSVRVVVLAGAGKAFCAGHDLKEIARHRADPDHGRAYLTTLFEDCAQMMLAVTQCPKPTIAMVDGIATAAGLQLVAWPAGSKSETDPAGCVTSRVLGTQRT